MTAEREPVIERKGTPGLGWSPSEVLAWGDRTMQAAAEREARASVPGYPSVGVPDSSGLDPMAMLQSMGKLPHVAALAAWYEGILTKVITAVGGALLNAELEHANLTPAELAVVERCEASAVGFTG